ncbi:restriction endonuclease [Myxococcus xanthus]|uniref:restriction endonuclease n=1 Tax=Myxococcus xanthus TaxID=34 RepID=UPI00112D3C11|nr:restriction endonuclease [Myxococcus xanthus]
MTKAPRASSNSSPALDREKHSGKVRELDVGTYDIAYLRRLEAHWVIEGEDEPHDPDLERDDGHLTEFDRFVEEVHRTRTACPYCNSKLRAAEYSPDGDEFYILSACLRCAYWQWFSAEEYEIQLIAAASVLRRYEERLPEECHAELVRQLNMTPGRWSELSPKGLEQLVAAVFRANYANAEALHVGRTGDGGVDVLFIESGGNEWLIQAKRREKVDAAEGVSTLRSLLGAMVLRQRKYGVIVSTADHFTYYAQKEAKVAAALGWRIELIDRGILNRMVGALLPGQPWRKFLENNFSSSPQLLVELNNYFATQLPVAEGYDPLGLRKSRR